MRIFAADVDYRRAPSAHTQARGAAAIFDDWHSEHAIWECVTEFDSVGDYESGAFYKRELPCLVALFESAQRVGVEPEVLVVDGYAQFGPARPALGQYLAQATSKPVIGVAKTKFHDAEHKEIRRGTSQSPLFITAVGIASDEAARSILAAHGAYRLPTMLRRVDALARGKGTPLIATVSTFPSPF